MTDDLDDANDAGNVPELNNDIFTSTMWNDLRHVWPSLKRKEITLAPIAALFGRYVS